MRFVLTILAIVALAPLAYGQSTTINWGNAVADTLIDSDGTALDASYTFSLGCFDADPLTLAYTDWESNWNEVDQADFNPAVGYFTDSVTIEGDGGSGYQAFDPDITPKTTWAIECAPGDQMYVWAYNDQTVTTSTEWALYSGATWAIPALTDPGTPVSWRLSGSSTPLFGATEMGVGDGSYTDPGPFDIRTHTFPVPEPSVALLLLFGAAFGAVRRSR